MFKSTRSNDEVKSANAIIHGISNDGGLYVPSNIHPINIHEIRNFSYRQLCAYILGMYFHDISSGDLEEIVSKSYNNKFDIDSIVQVKKTNDCYFLELFHGPTLAFKDISLSTLPYLILKSKENLNLNTKTMILTATSGDTGSASLHAFSSVEDIASFVIYPLYGISKIQEIQMLKATNDFNHAIALKGSFDDAQKIVRNIFSDSEIRRSIKNTQLTPSNSINIARLISQIVYYFYTYLDLLRRKEIEYNDLINFAVPSGNFGNILAAYLAKRMGLPINKLICASNKNRVLTEFFNSGVLNIKRNLYKTSSPSMDIISASNLERLLYFVTNEPYMVKNYMESLELNNQFTFHDLKLFKDFIAYSVNEEETLEGINKLFSNDNYMIDPHTSVGYMAYQKYLKLTSDKTKTVVVATAHPYKFSDTILKALSLDCLNTESENLRLLEDYTKLPIPSQLYSLETVLDKRVSCSIDEIYNIFKEKVNLCD